MSEHAIVNPATLPRPSGFSHGVVTRGDSLLFVAGQIGCGSNGTILSSDIVAQFSQALQNTMAVVREAGGKPESIARMTIYVTDVVEYRARLKGLGAAWRQVMGNWYPAVCLVEVKSLFIANSKCEIEATAVI